MRPAPRPRWQQATALVSLGAGGVVTGLSFVPASPADVRSPAALPFALMALEKSAKAAPSDDAVLRSAIVHMARHFLRMAEGKTPAEMEAIIWRHASLDGADHGPSCAAFASLTLALGSHVAGHESWVTGGTSYPWPLHAWADARVDPNPASPNVMSVLQEAQHHHRWHALGDGYDPQPGDWVLFDGHVEVVTSYDGGVLHTIGGDSLPNYSVNAHSYPGPLSGQGVAGFVDNGLQQAASPPAGGQVSAPSGHHRPARPARGAQAAPNANAAPAAPAAATPGRPATGSAGSPAALAPRAISVPPEVPQSSLAGSRVLVEANAEAGPQAARDQQPAMRPRARAVAQPAPKPAQPRRQAAGRSITPGDAGPPAHVAQGRKSGKADIPGTDLRPAPAAPQAKPGQAEIPGLLKRAPRRAASHRPATSHGELAPYRRHQPAPASQPAAPGSAFQRAFIEQVAPGAIATQHKYGVPASVTIAQAIDESAWGQSTLASHDHNLFGIKGTGPAGSDLLPTQEFTGGQLVDTTAPFRVYNDIGQSIEAHGKLLARSDYFANAMANRHQPNAFASALTGVYATDPSYGAKLIELMQHYNLYRFDVAAAARSRPPAATGAAAIPGIGGHGSPAQGRGASATAAQPAAGQAAPAEGTGAPGHATSPAPPSHAGHDRAAGRGAPRASKQGADGPGAAARKARRPGPADAGPASGDGIPGTWYPMRAARQARGAADQLARPGQADIPGLPGAAAAQSTPPGRRPRNSPRLRPAHSPVSGHRPHRAQPVGEAPAQRGRPSIGPASGAPGRARPDGAMPGSAASAAAAPHAAEANGHPRRARLNQVARADGSAPGSATSDPGRPAADPAAWMTAGLGGSLIPGVPPPPGQARTAAGSGAIPQYGPVAEPGAAPLDGAWIPGLPGDAAETTRHAPHPTAAARHGAGAIRSGHGTNLAPTRARRFGSAGQPSAQPSRRAAPVSHTSPPAAPPVLAPVSAQRAAARPAPAPATATAPPRSGVMPGLSDGGPPSGQRTAPAPVAPSSTPGPAPALGGVIPGAAPAAAATPPPTPTPGAGAGATHGASAPMPATTTAVTAVRYSHHLPPAVGKAYVNSAKVPLVRGEPLYVDVAAQSGLSWEILAACDWMECKARPGLSPVYGEKLGTVNPDGTSYRTRSAALERCAYDLLELARSVYHIDLTRSGPLSVRELANAFAAYRWGGLLKEHHTSAMEFPYSVAGLTTQHMHMRWPNIDDPHAPDKPGARFHQPFGAVPLVLSLNYPATA